MKKTSLAILTLTTVASISFAAKPVKPAAPASKAIKATIPMAPAVNFNFLPEVVAEVNGKKITKAQIIQVLLAPMGGKIPQGVSQEELKSATMRMVPQFVQNMAMLDAASKAGFKPSVEMCARTMRDSLKEVPPTQLKMLKASLQKQGLTLEKLIEMKSKDKFTQIQVANEEFLKSNTITDKEAKAYYDANPVEFKALADPKGSMRISRILIFPKIDPKTRVPSNEAKAAAKAKAENLLKSLRKNPASFEELALKNSQCPSARNKGSLGVFTKGDRPMPPELKQTVVNLKPGEISGVVETGMAYQIIRRDALRKAAKIPFAKVKKSLKGVLTRQKIFKAAKIKIFTK